MTQASIRSFWLAFFSALVIIFLGVMLIIIDTHSKSMSYLHGKEMLDRLLIGAQLLERSGTSAAMAASYEARTYSAISLTVDSTRAPPADISTVWLDRDTVPHSATLYSNVTKSYITLTELSKWEEGHCSALAAGMGVGVTLSTCAGLWCLLIIGNFVAYHRKLAGAAISYGFIFVTPIVMMMALLTITGHAQLQCERFERGEQQRVTVDFIINLAGALIKMPGQTTDTTEAELTRLVNAANAAYEGAEGRQFTLFRGGVPSPSTVIAPPYSKINPAMLRHLINIGVARTTFFIVDAPTFDGVVAKGYQSDSGLWLILQEQMPKASNQLAPPHLRPGLVVGLVAAVILSLVSALIFPFPSLGTTAGQRPGMAPTSDISSLWPVSKVVSMGLIATVVGAAVMSNLALSTSITRYYAESRAALLPLVAAYTDLQTVSVNTAMMSANATLGQDWDSSFEVYPSFVNETVRTALVDEQQTIRSITSDYIDRFGPLGVYQAGFGTNYLPFVQTTAAKGFLSTLTNPDHVKAATIYMNRAELAFLTLLLTQNTTFETEMVNWLNMITTSRIGAAGPRGAVITALTSLTSPLRSAVAQVSLTDARSQIARLSAAGTITNYTHSLYLEMLRSGTDPVTAARITLRASRPPVSSELCFYMIDAGSAIAVATILFISAAVGLDSWYTPTFLARKRSPHVIAVVFLIITASGLSIAAVLGAAAALTSNIADMGSSIEQAHRLFDLVPKLMGLFDTSARSLAEWLLVLQSPTSLALNHAMAIDNVVRSVLQSFIDGVPDASDPQISFILDLTSDMGDALNAIFSVVARDYRDARTPLWDVADAMDSLYRTANATIISDRLPFGAGGSCGCSTLEDTSALTSTTLEMARSVILRSVNLWTLPALYSCCTDAHATINQHYRRAIIYMQVQAVDEGSLTTTDIATLGMRATLILTKMQTETTALQNRITAEISFKSRNWLVGFWVSIVLVWGTAFIGVWVLKLTRLELNSATK